MDITADGFGYMLAVGDLLWVPFTYSLQARYLAFEHVELGGVGTGIVILVASTGYWIFRSANGEKNDFRNGRNPKSRFFRWDCVRRVNSLFRRSHLYGHEAGDKASYFRLVGKVTASQLLVSLSFFSAFGAFLTSLSVVIC